MSKHLVADDIVLASRDDLDAALESMARAQRMVFFAGLPGVGKSMFIRELARVAHAMGRSVHLLQWDVVRPVFESPAILARYPERDGVTHPVVRKLVGLWARQAVVRWHRAQEGAPALLIGEAPLIGNRLLELVQVHADAAEPLLAGPQALFAIPVPSVAVREAIERARKRTFANPSNPREEADAPPDLLHRVWRDTRSLAVEIGAAAPDPDPAAPFDPLAYAAVYRHLLRRRNAVTVRVDVQLEQDASVYHLAVAATDIVPGDDEASELLARVERERSMAAIEDEVARWFHSI